MRPAISIDILSEIQSALNECCAAVMATDLDHDSQVKYIDSANNFVRWLRGNFDLGSQNAPYSLKKKQGVLYRSTLDIQTIRSTEGRFPLLPIAPSTSCT
jgi:hypothetical protein